MMGVMKMRPKILEIEGLQSFKEVQRIDFDDLGETGLFGIFGPTGSGKSTVLDAITFALFGKVERAARGTQGIIHANMNSVRVSFTFELKKDNSKKQYRVERVYNRKKNTDNACEPKIARLIEVSEAGEIPLCDKATEVSNKVEELIGLNHEDFTRAVVLPQNKFQEFLMLDTSKKREMLERIFYLEEYGRQLTDKVQRKISSIKTRLSHVEGILSQLGDASGEAVMESTQRLQLAMDEKKKAESQLKIMEVQYSEAKELWQLVQDMTLLNLQEKTHASMKEIISKKLIDLQKAIYADDLMTMIIRHREISERLKATLSELSKVEESLPTMIRELDCIQNQHEAQQSEVEVKRPAMMETRTRLMDALGLMDQITAYTQEIVIMHQKGTILRTDMETKDQLISSKKLEITNGGQALGELRAIMEPLTVDPEYRQAMQMGVSLQTEMQNVERESNAFYAKIKLLREKIGKLDIKEKELINLAVNIQREMDILIEKKDKHEGAKPGERNAIIQRTRELNELQIISNDLKRITENILSLKGKEKDLLGLAQVYIEKKTEAAYEFENAKALVEKYRQVVLEQEKALEQYSAYILSKKLIEGEPCPVCGSDHHPHLADITGDMDIYTKEQELSSAKEQLASSAKGQLASSAKEQLKSAEDSMRIIENKSLILNEKIRSIDTQLQQLQSEICIVEKDHEKKAALLPENLRIFRPGELVDYINKESQHCEKILKAIEVWEQTIEVINKEHRDRNEQLSLIRIDIQTVTTELKVNHDNLTQYIHDAEEVSRQYNEKKDAYQSFLQTYPVKSAVLEIQRIAEDDKKYSRLLKETDQSQKVLQANRDVLEKLLDARNELSKQVASAEMEEKGIRQQCLSLEDKVKLLSGDVDIREGIRRIDIELDKYVQVEKQYKEKYVKLQEQYNLQLTKQSTLINQKEIYTKSYEKEEIELKNAMENKNFSDIIEVEKSILPKDKQQILDTEIKGYQRKADSLQTQHQILENKLNGRTITEIEWDQLSEKYREIAEQKEASVTRFEVEKSTYDKLIERHQKWVNWNEVFTELSQKSGLLEQIQKLLKGDKGKDNSFVDYIAEERLRYVAAKASETLGFITRYKYALELDINAGFIIRDNGNGGISRMVSSLSGGETFLASLSLALALSEQIQLKGQSPLEFFFLDEGFGTLDNQLLDTVIDSLERLSSKDRIIGIISHVPDLRARIARRLIVDPPTSEGEGSQVRIEKA